MSRTRYMESHEPHIEIIPMIDIMMFLLVFFMLVMLKMIQGGLDIAAVHNHLLRANPPTFYMHVAGTGDPAQLARIEAYLLPALGPIARHLITKVARQSATLPELYRKLAEQINVLMDDVLHRPARHLVGRQRLARGRQKSRQQLILADPDGVGDPIATGKQIGDDGNFVSVGTRK